MPPQKAPPRRKPAAPTAPPTAPPPADPLAFVTERHEPNGPATVRLRLRVLEQEVPLAFVVPGAPTRPRRLLPALHQLSTLLTEAAVAREAAAGREISCRKGCGACCRQLVPITEPECLRLRELVEALPEPQRGAVLARFADAQERLQAAGVLADLQARASLESPAVAGSPAATADEAQEAFWRLAMRYVAAHPLPLPGGRGVLDPPRAPAGVPRVPGHLPRRALRRDPAHARRSRAPPRQGLGRAGAGPAVA